MALVTYTRLGMNARRLFWEIVSHPNIQLLVTMNEASGAVLDRCVRNRLSGTVNGSPTRGVTLANGFVGMAFARATPDYMGFGSQSALNFGNNSPFSLLCVINPNVSALGTICAMRDDDSQLGAWSWGLRASREQEVLLFGSTSGISRVSGAVLTNGTVYMLGVTVDGTGAVAGILPYLNGVAETPVTITNTLSGLGNNLQAFTIGAIDTGGGSYTGEALNANALGFVAVFNAVLTANEMRHYAWWGGFL